MELRVGTSGFSYKPWKGVFYPEDLPNDRMLEYYASQLPAVEIDNTFYRMPKREVLETWRTSTPESFRFTIKASRRITHFKRLKETEDVMGFLLGNLEVLGDKLGAVLFQLPPNFPKNVERLQSFLELIPPGYPAAFEFRHASWFTEEVYDALRRRACALCCADVEDTAAAEPADGSPEDALANAAASTTALISTADWGYLRLRRDDYDAAAMRQWWDRVHAQGWKRAFIFFKHEDAGTGPRFAAEFLAQG